MHVWWGLHTNQALSACKSGANPHRSRSQHIANDVADDVQFASCSNRQPFQIGPRSEKQYHFSILCPEDGWIENGNAKDGQVRYLYKLSKVRPFLSRYEAK